MPEIDFELELIDRNLTCAGKTRRLSELEARLLSTLAESALGRKSYRELNLAVYGEDYFTTTGLDYRRNTGALRNLAEELRKKFRDLVGTNVLANESRLGYALTRSIVVKTDTPTNGFATRAPPIEPLSGSPNGKMDPPCPYRGLEVFREEDAALFHGRELFVEHLYQTIDRKRLVALVGPSGSGKSSLVRAGLIPRLNARRWPDTTWAAVSFSPGHDPFDSLASALITRKQPALKPGSAEAKVERLSMAGALEDGSVPLQAQLDDLRRSSEDAERVLVFVDQFEELFTQTREAQRRLFVDTLLRLGASDTVSVLLTLRADFYGHAFGLGREFSDQLRDAVVNLRAMTPEELQRAIVKPGATAELRFAPGLVDTIIEDLGDEAGTLPLLQFALQQLWRERTAGEVTLESYRAIGGVTGALAQWAQTTYDALPVDQQAVARRVLLRMTVPGEDANHTRERVLIKDLPNRGGARQVEEVVNILADARLLTTSRDPLSGEPSVEISHEALIRSWDAFAEWIKTERDWLREHRRLADAVREWTPRRDEDLLYRGARLTAVSRLRVGHAADLSADEDDFLLSSERLEGRRERARYLGQAAGGAVGMGVGYGFVFALGFATKNPGPNALILVSTTFAALMPVGQMTGFAIGLALWHWRSNVVERGIAAAVAGGVIGTIGFLAYLRLLGNSEPTWQRAAVGASIGLGLGLGLAIGRQRWRRLGGAIVGGVIGTAIGLTIGGINWGVPVTIAAGLALGALTGAGFYLTSAEDRDQPVEKGKL